MVALAVSPYCLHSKGVHESKPKSFEGEAIRKQRIANCQRIREMASYPTYRERNTTIPCISLHFINLVMQRNFALRDLWCCSLSNVVNTEYGIGLNELTMSLTG
jgi:hypothetical protein